MGRIATVKPRPEKRRPADAHTATPPLDALAGSRALVLGLFLFSGVSGLIYEVVWSRMFVLVLGSTVYAVSTVLAVFMGGLALGSWLFGKVADRPGVNGLRIYAWLELGIGAFALLLPTLMRISDEVYRSVWPSVSDSFAGLLAVRLLLAAMILIVPSTLMGGTLPVLSRFLVRTRERTGLEIGTLYAINTLGAMLGCFVTGFFLLEYLGAQRALWSAAGLNFVVGLSALLWARRSVVPAADRASKEEAPANVQRYGPVQVRLALVLYALSGFAALALEILWTRSLMYFTSVDMYAFTAMLSAFLCGIGLGSLLISPFVGRIRHPLLVLGVLEVLIGVSAAASIPLFKVLYGSFVLVDHTVPAATLLKKIIPKLFCSFFIMLIPTLLMGAAFPLVSAIYVGARRRIGRGIGTLYALNTLGAIGGSVAAGFALIPVFGLQRGILLCASLYVVLGVLLCTAAPRARGSRTAGVALSTLAVLLLVLANLGYAGEPIIYQSRLFKDPYIKHRLVYYDEGPAATLAVLENQAGTKLLNINGVTTAINNYRDMQVHRMLSHLPMLLHPEPRKVLIVGFGMGSTPWGCCQYDLQRVDVVELLRSEKRTAPIFEDVNHGVLNHPKLNFIEGDGRNYLLATRELYDMVSFNAIHPKYSAYLYTRDFYELCRERMTANGVICAWMTQNSMKDSEFRMLCRSFVEVFPNSSLWFCNPEHFCLIGTMQPTRIDLADWQKRMAIEAVRADLADSNLDDPFVLVSRYLLGPDSLADYVAGAPLNTDDHPRIEFMRTTASREEERPIIEELIARRESVLPLLEPTSLTDWARQRLALYEQGTLWMMKGQVEHWYPDEDHPLSFEIAFRQALLLCPEAQDFRHLLVFSESVKRDAQRVLQADPNHVGALTRMGAVLMEEGRLEQAEVYLGRALQLHGGFLPARELLGFLYLFGGDLERGADRLRTALEAKPDDPRLLYALSVALERQGRSQQAAEYRRTALVSSPGEVAEWFALWEQTVGMMRARNESGLPQRGPG